MCTADIKISSFFNFAEKNEYGIGFSRHARMYFVLFYVSDLSISMSFGARWRRGVVVSGVRQ